MSAKTERLEAHSHLNLVVETAGEETSIPTARALAPALRPPVEVSGPQTAGRKPGSRRRSIILGDAVLLVLGVAGWYGEYWWTVGRFTVSTDDAYVYAHNTTIAAKVPGYLATIQVA
ncbi:MAG TPA: HlyD family secretion protein, partial [Xanthobacteraceae bacterium]|nr:HlyD family secretion protein [Xanthobacteraceae bacterium]